MATIAIKDTGWYNTSRVGTQATVKAASGSAILLQAASVAVTSEATSESSLLPGMVETNSQPVGYSRPALSVTVLIRKDQASDMTVYKQIFGDYERTEPGLNRTPGVKLLYVTGTADVVKTHVETYGSTSLEFHGNEISAGLPAIPGYVTKISSTDVPNTKLTRLSFDFVET